MGSEEKYSIFCTNSTVVCSLATGTAIQQRLAIGFRKQFSAENASSIGDVIPRGVRTKDGQRHFGYCTLYVVLVKRYRQPMAQNLLYYSLLGVHYCLLPAASPHFEI